MEGIERCVVEKGVCGRAGSAWPPLEGRLVRWWYEVAGACDAMVGPMRQAASSEGPANGRHKRGRARDAGLMHCPAPGGSGSSAGEGERDEGEEERDS